MKRTIQVMALVLAISASTLAGDMQNGYTAPPPPPPANSTQATTEQRGQTTGDMQGGLTVITVKVALQLLTSLLPLF